MSQNRGVRVPGTGIVRRKSPSGRLSAITQADFSRTPSCCKDCAANVCVAGTSNQSSFLTVDPLPKICRGRVCVGKVNFAGGPHAREAEKSKGYRRIVRELQIRRKFQLHSCAKTTPDLQSDWTMEAMERRALARVHCDLKLEKQKASLE